MSKSKRPQTPGEIFAARREELGVSRYWLAGAVGLSDEAIRLIETGGGDRMTLAAFRRMCGALGLEPGDVLGMLAPPPPVEQAGPRKTPRKKAD